MDVFADKMVEYCTTGGLKLILALVIYVIGRIVISWLLKLFDRIPSVGNLDETAKSFLRTFVKAALYVVLAVSIISELGVPMASLVAVIASCGLAIGMAMQGSLSNLAGGIMLLIFRPFNVGDYISAGGESGTVKKISLFYTLLTTVDNQLISIPNGSMMNSNITNATAEETRRVDLDFNISGDVPVKKVQSTIMQVIINTEKALADPAPVVEPVVGIPGGLQYTVRTWVRTEDYWDVYFELMREIPSALGEASIGGPAAPVKVTN